MSCNENRATPDIFFNYNQREFTNNINYTQQQIIELLKGKISSSRKNNDSFRKIINFKLGSHDFFSAEHSCRISEKIPKLSDFLNQLDEKIDVEDMENAGLLHDIGKVCVPKKTLTNEKALNADEVRQIQHHPHFSFMILKDIPGINSNVLNASRYHHENWDGTGYPYGLKGEDIPYIARVLSVIDTFDALTSKRSYHVAMSTEKALQTMKADSNKCFDPKILNTFVKFVSQSQQGNGQILQLHSK